MRSIRFALALLLASCATKSTTSMVVVAEAGQKDGKAVEVYTLTAGGITARITNFGTIVMSLQVPDRTGKMGDVVLGFDSPAGYYGGHPFFGCTAGRVANRIANATFDLDGKTYTLAKNNAPHMLHGGAKGFDKYVWDAEVGNGVDGPWVRFTRVSPDGEEGFPGTLTATVTYTVTPKSELKVEMTATTDKPTLV